jgi:hypothetical protein
MKMSASSQDMDRWVMQQLIERWVFASQLDKQKFKSKSTFLR